MAGAATSCTRSTDLKCAPRTSSTTSATCRETSIDVPRDMPTPAKAGAGRPKGRERPRAARGATSRGTWADVTREVARIGHEPFGLSLEAVGLPCDGPEVRRDAGAVDSDSWGDRRHLLLLSADRGRAEWRARAHVSYCVIADDKPLNHGRQPRRRNTPRNRTRSSLFMSISSTVVRPPRSIR